MFHKLYSIHRLVFTPIRPFIKQSKLVGLFLGNYIYFNHFISKHYTIMPKDQINEKQISGLSKITQQSIEIKISRYASLKKKIGYIIWQIIRFIHLIIIFSPCIVLLPLKYSKLTENFWLNLFVGCIQRAGVVWIKTFQYLSHRRDMIGQAMANKFIHLRQNAPQHSFRETNSSFKKQFGKNIKDIFQEFNDIPIASGSVSQVYQAVYKGQKVAVKVRHPGVQKYISRDLDLLFYISKVLSKISKRFQIPVGAQSLKRTLTQQIDFNIEANNLRIFGEMFKNNDKVRFPVAIDQVSRQSILIQNFIQGVPITYYEKNKHKLNRVIARIGAVAFFQMLINNNFIHADCHGGNIMITIKQQVPTWLDSIKDKFSQFYSFIEKKLVDQRFSSKIFKELYLESQKQQHQLRQLQKYYKQKVQVTLIDVGMVIKLEESDRTNFVNFLKCAIQQRSEDCAKMIYSLSLYDGKKIIQGNQEKYKQYYQQLNTLFAEIKLHTLKDLDGNKLFKKMLDIIRDYRMKLDGQFATLLTNMLVLQAIAKDLNPEISILKCAIPYFKLQ